MTTHCHRCVIPAELAGKRLDQALSALFGDYSRSSIKRWIDDGQVTVNGRSPRPRDPVASGDEITLTATLAASAGLEPEPVGFEVVHADRDCLVVMKPAGCVVHPGAGNPGATLANGLLERYPELADLPRAGLVHRLDKDTSGLLLVARTPGAFQALTAAMARREIHRHYLAVVNGVLVSGGTVDAAIGRDPVHRTRMAVRPGGREAVSRYRVRQRYRLHTLIEVELETGRTHQIRVHMAHCGYPLVGDLRYGGRLRLPREPLPLLEETLKSFKRQALHAERLAFVQPADGRQISVSQPPPADFLALTAALRADRNDRGG